MGVGCLELEALLVSRRMILQNRLADDKGQCLLPFSLFSEIQRKPLLRKKRERKKGKRKKEKRKKGKKEKRTKRTKRSVTCQWDLRARSRTISPNK